MPLTKVSSKALVADLVTRGFTAERALAILAHAQRNGEYRGITFRIVADEDEQAFYVENYRPAGFNG